MAICQLDHKYRWTIEVPVSCELAESLVQQIERLQTAGGIAA